MENGKIILMHRVINNTPEKMQTDHINRNKLDNRRSNLRTVTGGINRFNIGLRKNNTSGITGISWNKSKRKWKSRIWINSKQITLGDFKEIKLAFEARKQAEIRYYGVAS